jgi:hypothetical protein
MIQVKTPIFLNLNSEFQTTCPVLNSYNKLRVYHLFQKVDQMCYNNMIKSSPGREY